MTHPYDHNPYIAMLDTAQAAIKAREAEKKALEAQLRSLIDVATAALDMMLVSKERMNLVIAISKAKEAMQ